MNLPENCHLAYVVQKEAWWANAGHMAHDDPTIWVQAAHNEGGAPWEFTVVEVPGIGTKLAMFDEAWRAFNDIPEFFQALTAAGRGTTLADVRRILDDLGAVGKTERARVR